MPATAGNVPVNSAQGTAVALPGVAPPRERGMRQVAIHASRPAAVGRAGLFLWVPVCLALGIGGWFHVSGQISAPQWALLGFLAGLGMLAARIALPLAEQSRIGWPLGDGLRVAGYAVMLIVAGFGLAQIRAMQVAAPVLEWRYYGPIEGRLIQIDRSSRDRMRITLDQVVLRDLEPNKTPKSVRLSLMQPAEGGLPPLGQHIMLTGHLGPPAGPAAPDSFDFRQMAYFAGLGAVGYSRTPIMAVAPPEGGRWAMHRARMAISAAIQEGIGGQAGAVASALMTGDRSGIAEATNDVMRASNLYHIISISGLHMSMLAGFVYTSLRLALVLLQGAGLRMRIAVHKLAASGALIASAGYLWLSGGGVATERSFLMVAVMLIAILVDRRAISLRTIALAAILILIYSPEALLTPGFQMSFAATIALILTAGPWARYSPALPFWLRPVVLLLLSSLVASIATSPIAAAHFNRMSQYGMLANLLSVPVMGALVMPAGVIGALLAPLGLAQPALWVMGLGTKWMLWVAEFVAGLNGAVTAIPLPPPSVIPLLEFGAAIAILTWRAGLLKRLASPTGFAFCAGLAMITSAALIWGAASRPLLLIAPEGEAVGLMTTEGRAVSKASGGGFVIDSWLLEDGDTATQQQSAERPGWSGENRSRQADLPQGWKIRHLTGKGAAERAVTACTTKSIVVVSAVVQIQDNPPCILLDLRRLRKTGAVAVETQPDGPRLTTVAETQPTFNF